MKSIFTVLLKLIALRLFYDIKIFINRFNSASPLSENSMEILITISLHR